MKEEGRQKDDGDGCRSLAGSLLDSPQRLRSEGAQQWQSHSLVMPSTDSALVTMHRDSEKGDGCSSPASQRCSGSLQRLNDEAVISVAPAGYCSASKLATAGAAGWRRQWVQAAGEPEAELWSGKRRAEPKSQKKKQAHEREAKV